MYLGLQGTGILLGFLRVSVVVRQKACMHAIGATTSGQARSLYGDAIYQHYNTISQGWHSFKTARVQLLQYAALFGSFFDLPSPPNHSTYHPLPILVLGMDLE